MASPEIEQRIEERTRIAEARMAEETPYQRFVTRSGLFLANSADRIDPPVQHSAREVYEEGMWGGIMRGGIMGAVVGIIGAALLAGTVVGAGIPLLILGAAVAGATITGLKDANDALEHDVTRFPKNDADRIAKSMHLATSDLPVTKGPNETLRRTGNDPSAVDRVQALLSEQNTNSQGFAAREDARRLNSSTSRQR